MPKCTGERIDFGRLGRRVIDADVSVGEPYSDGGLRWCVKSSPAHVAANSELIARVEANRVRALDDPLPPLPDVATITDTIPRHASVTWLSVFACRPIMRSSAICTARSA
jgi:hypothetical protein